MIPSRNTVLVEALPKLNQFQLEQELPQHIPNPNLLSMSYQMKMTTSQRFDKIEKRIKFQSLFLC